MSSSIKLASVVTVTIKDLNGTVRGTVTRPGEVSWGSVWKAQFTEASDLPWGDRCGWDSILI